MHELSLAESIVQIIESSLRDSPDARPRLIRLQIGALSHADPEALQFCFDAVAQGTVASRALLEIERAPGRAWCHDCAAEVALSALGAPCPECDGYALRVTGGDELRVRDMEVE